MSKPLKIAIYSGVIPSSTFIERLILGLAKEKNTSILLFGNKRGNTSYPNGIKEISFNNRWVKLLQYLKYSVLLSLFRSGEKKQLDRFITSKKGNVLQHKIKFYPVLWHRPDIFHLQWAKGIEDWVWVKSFGMKLVLSLRGTHINQSPIGNNELRDRYKTYFPEVDGFHAVSNAISREAQRYNADKNKISVVYTGLELDEASGPVRQDNGKFKIISVGRPHWIKGYTYAIDACKLLEERGIDFEYKIIGASRNIELAYQIKDLKLQDHVMLVDRLPFNKVQEDIANSNLLLLPSLDEGIANVVLEAMLLNTPVLSTDCGGMTEVITDQQNGFIVPIRDSKLMANAIVDIMKLPSEEIKRVTANAYKKVKAQHNVQAMVADMMQLYNRL